jgi:hypothetical protein
MEKRFRDYLRHLEKLDLDIISEEEVLEERRKLELELNEVHNEMIRTLIPMMGTLICASIFLATGFAHMFIGNFICAALSGVAFICFLFSYRTLSEGDRQLRAFIDKLSVH